MPRLSGVTCPLGHLPAPPFSSAFERRCSRLAVRFNMCSFVGQVNCRRLPRPCGDLRALLTPPAPRTPLRRVLRDVPCAAGCASVQVD